MSTIHNQARNLCSVIEHFEPNTYKIHDACRTWTRGDGTRYTDPIRITASSDTKFSSIISQMNLKKIGKVKGEFGSDPYSDAYMFNGYVVVDRGNYLHFMSKSRITNKRSVWRFQKT